ncbi:MAG: hypothetical protein GWN00_07215 [Aliifodinibius sp.]|nr:hypothetical protein [Fodinibius sp.]NIV11018.1 hypothetical protein [Fodinibius sp.]NIY24605.1 hypothetical protein [Fodinibius sp.]
MPNLKANLARYRNKKGVRSEITLETWTKLRRLVESGEIRTIQEGVRRAVEEFVKKYFNRKGD